jgi:hypothetical protein
MELLISFLWDRGERIAVCPSLCLRYAYFQKQKKQTKLALWNGLGMSTCIEHAESESTRLPLFCFFHPSFSICQGPRERNLMASWSLRTGNWEFSKAKKTDKARPMERAWYEHLHRTCRVRVHSFTLWQILTWNCSYHFYGIGEKESQCVRLSALDPCALFPVPCLGAAGRP